jgi:hypothetical protein
MRGGKYGMGSAFFMSGITTIIWLLLVILSIGVTIFFIYVAYLAMVALKIYIKKNSD